MRRLTPILITLALLSGGCKAFVMKSAMNTTADVLGRGRTSMNMESDPYLARDAIPGALKTLESFHIANPSNKKLIAYLAEGYCQYSTGFVQDAAERAQLEGKFDEADHYRARATGLFLRCMNYGLKLLPKKWEQNIFGEIEVVEAMVKKAGKGQLDGMFWVALGLASAINMNRDDIAMVAHLPKAQMILERVVALDEDYKNGLGVMALGMMHSARSQALGGEPEKGKQYFERAIELTGGKFLLIQVMFARHYCVLVQNRELFHKLLVGVLQTDPAIFPEQRLANELAHLKARLYLKYESSWF